MFEMWLTLHHEVNFICRWLKFGILIVTPTLGMGFHYVPNLIKHFCFANGHFDKILSWHFVIVLASIHSSSQESLFPPMMQDRNDIIDGVLMLVIQLDIYK